jgi:nucleoside-diphosphate-sugar epimerase
MSYEPQLQGVQNLAYFVRQSPYASTIRVIFTSSTSAAQSWDQSLGPYPEHVIQDAKFAVGAGYGESKYITERVSPLYLK